MSYQTTAKLHFHHCFGALSTCLAAPIDVIRALRGVSQWESDELERTHHLRENEAEHATALASPVGCRFQHAEFDTGWSMRPLPTSPQKFDTLRVAFGGFEERVDNDALSQEIGDNFDESAALVDRRNLDTLEVLRRAAQQAAHSATSTSYGDIADLARVTSAPDDQVRGLRIGSAYFYAGCERHQGGDLAILRSDGFEVVIEMDHLQVMP
jgi:hypothetical protein